MFSLINMCMATILHYMMENLENAMYSKVQGLLEILPPLYKRELVSSVMDKLYSLMLSQEHRESYTSPAKQREMIPLLKLLFIDAHSSKLEKNIHPSCI